MASKHTIDYCSRTTHPGLDGHRIDRTVSAACTALHTGIPVLDMHPFAVHLQDLMRADLQAHPASGAFVSIDL